MTDPISDMLTRIRNAVTAKHDVVEVPSSKVKLSIAKLLKEGGYIKDYHEAEYKGQGKILINLKYTDKKRPSIVGMRRISTPGRRVYVGYRDLRPVLGGLGMAILSTSKGLVTDQEAKKMKLGGEPLLNIW